LYQIIVDNEEIKKAQAKFEDILKYKIIPLKRKLSHPRTKEDFEEKKDNLFDIYWSSQFEFWSAFDHNKPRNKNRYWNCFGLKNPLNNESLTITIEICIPKKGEIKNIAGLFIIDNKTKDIAIVSRGKLSRKKMKVFWDNYKGETINLIDGTKVALIGILPTNENKIIDFHGKLKDFLLEVKRIKSIGIEDSVDLFEEKQVLKPIWLECLRELFEEAEKRNDKEITISVLDLQHYAQNKNIKNVKLTNRPRSIFYAMRSREVLEEDDIIINNTDSSTTFTIKYKLPRKKIIEKQNLIYNNTRISKTIINKPKAILIKSKKPEQLLVNINEAFSKILPYVVNFIGTALKEDSNNWVKYAKKDLSDMAVTNLHLEGSIDDFIMNLDILTSFHIIINNWDDMFMKKIPKSSRKDFLDYTHRLKTIRNNIKAHDTMNLTEQYNKDRFDHDIGTMILFIDHIDKNIAEELRKMKNNP